MANHTPGPWTIDHQHIGPWGAPVALLCDMTAASPPRTRANARLIAAAPDLLAALETLAEWCGDSFDSWDGGEIDESQLDWLGLHEVLDRATAAIAKARGGEWRLNPSFVEWLAVRVQGGK